MGWYSLFHLLPPSSLPLGKIKNEKYKIKNKNKNSAPPSLSAEVFALVVLVTSGFLKVSKEIPEVSDQKKKFSPLGTLSSKLKQMNPFSKEGKSPPPPRPSREQIERFFKITSSLPPSLQMSISRKVYRSSYLFIEFELANQAATRILTRYPQ